MAGRVIIKNMETPKIDLIKDCDFRVLSFCKSILGDNLYISREFGKQEIDWQQRYCWTSTSDFMPFSIRCRDTQEKIIKIFNCGYGSYMEIHGREKYKEIVNDISQKIAQKFHVDVYLYFLKEEHYYASNGFNE